MQLQFHFSVNNVLYVTNAFPVFYHKEIVSPPPASDAIYLLPWYDFLRRDDGMQMKQQAAHTCSDTFSHSRKITPHVCCCIFHFEPDWPPNILVSSVLPPVSLPSSDGLHSVPLWHVEIDVPQFLPQ
jgi:hypothetical protein